MMRAYRLVRVPKSTADRSWERPSSADHFALGSESARIYWTRWHDVSKGMVAHTVTRYLVGVERAVEPTPHPPTSYAGRR